MAQERQSEYWSKFGILCFVSAKFNVMHYVSDSYVGSISFIASAENESKEVCETKMFGILKRVSLKTAKLKPYRIVRDEEARCNLNKLKHGR